jgi:hypothetical protein
VSNLVYPSSANALRGLDVVIVKEYEFNTLVQLGSNEQTTRIAQSQNPIWHWSLTYNYLKNNPNDIPPGYIYTDLQQLMGFGLARQGAFDDFLYDDLDDNTVAGLLTNTWPRLTNIPIGYSILDSSNRWQQVTSITTGITGAALPTFTGTTTSDAGVTWTNRGTYTVAGYPNPGGVLQVVTDGTFFYSPLQRTMGGQFAEDITDLNTSTVALQVYANGVLKTGGGTDYSLLGPGLVIPGASYQGLYLKWVAGSPTQPVTATFKFYFRVRFEMDKQDFEKFVSNVWTIGGPHGKNGGGVIKLVSSRAPGV